MILSQEINNVIEIRTIDDRNGFDYFVRDYGKYILLFHDS